MPVSTGLRLNVADVLRHPGLRRAVEVAEPIEGLAAGAVVVPEDEPVQVELRIERVQDGVVVRGAARTRWSSMCVRCLRQVSAEMKVHFDEFFEPHPIEGETYPIEHDSIDLEQMVRDSLITQLPAAPLCRPDCAGLCPECGAELGEQACGCARDDTDPRWAALRQLQH